MKGKEKFKKKDATRKKRWRRKNEGKNRSKGGTKKCNNRKVLMGWCMFITFIILCNPREGTVHEDHYQKVVMFPCVITHLPNKSSFMSLAACSPASFRFFSICLLRSRAALSSAECPQPILRPTSFTNVATPVSVHESEKHTPPPPGLGAGQNLPTTPVTEQVSKNWLLQISTTSLRRTELELQGTRQNTGQIRRTSLPLLLRKRTRKLPVNSLVVVYLSNTLRKQTKWTYP